MNLASRLASIASFALGATIAVASGGSVYDYYHSEEYLEQAKAFYLEQAENPATPWAAKRAQIIADAQESCGGRYQGVDTQLILLQSDFSEDKADSSGESFNVSSKDTWLVVENIRCSYHGGFDTTVLNSVVLKGYDGANLQYADGSEKPEISGVSRSFELGEPQLKEWVKAPYDAQD